MDAHFVEMLQRLKLTKRQREDAKTKYTSVAKLLHNAFYETEYNRSTRLLIGSYGKKTNIRPPGDVDLLFKIPAETLAQYQNYEGNGPAALLQKIRDILGDTFTATEKISAWGKVVLVQFSDGTHNVELLPGYEADGVFIIPNSENGGSWDSFDARADLAVVADSNARTGGVTRKLIRIVKRWRKRNTTMRIKAYELEQFCAQFLDENEYEGKPWAVLVADFFEWLASVTSQDATFIETARSRATKAVDYEQRGKPVHACNEWRKVFGNRTFPAYSESLSKVYALAVNDVSDQEEHIEDRYPVRIDPRHRVTVTATVTGKGFRSHSLQAFLSKYLRLPKQLDIVFQANNVPPDSKLLWKIRNFGAAARAVGDLRGQIHDGIGPTRKESSKYLGTHYAECYVIQNKVCVARAMQLVPIGGE
jgi:hypothetical protein